MADLFTNGIPIVCMQISGTSAAHAGYKSSWGSREGNASHEFTNFGQYVASHRQANGQLKLNGNLRKIITHLRQGDFDHGRALRGLDQLAQKYHRKAATIATKGMTSALEPAAGALSSFRFGWAFRINGVSALFWPRGVRQSAWHHAHAVQHSSFCDSR